ncbi:hypothetical protein IIB79_01295, partial [candidate division KSB1 bacterium]|nr:hypothetical protein [candidate division KSB1 bacterium]
MDEAAGKNIVAWKQNEAAHQATGKQADSSVKVLKKHEDWLGRLEALIAK